MSLGTQSVSTVPCPLTTSRSSSRNTASIYLHQKLAYDRTYYVTIEPGVITDTSGAPFAGISDANTWAFSTKSAGPAAGTNALTVAALTAPEISAPFRVRSTSFPPATAIEW